MKRILASVLLTTVLACGGEDPIEPGPPLDIDSTTWFRAVDLGLNLEKGYGTSDTIQFLIPGTTEPRSDIEGQDVRIEVFWLNGEKVLESLPLIWIAEAMADGDGGWKGIFIVNTEDHRDPPGLYMYHAINARWGEVISNKARLCVTRCP